jgi:hypothetical protein
MRGLEQAHSQGLIFAVGAIASFFSVDFAIGLIYCLAFISAFERHINLPTLFAVSIFADVYSSAVVGATFLSVAIIRTLARRLKLTFQNFAISVGYLLLSLLVCKLVSLALVGLMGYRFHMFSHFMQIFWALFIYTIHRFFQIVGKIMESHAY